MTPTLRPVIGITTYVGPASWGMWRDVPVALVPHGYVAHVESAGGIVVLLPPRVDATDDLAAALIARLDGLVISGGGDVDPRRYGAVPHAETQRPRPERDALDLALAHAAVAADLPLLGICRGMQVMAVAAGGSLVQHLPDVVGSTAHCPGPATYGATTVTCVPGSVMAGAVGESVDVLCHHHQAVADAPGYVLSTYASDGTPEAMEAPSARFRVAVQWHPEASTETALIRALVEAASARVYRPGQLG